MGPLKRYEKKKVSKLIISMGLFRRELETRGTSRGVMINKDWQTIVS